MCIVFMFFFTEPDVHEIKEEEKKRITHRIGALFSVFVIGRIENGI